MLDERASLASARTRNLANRSKLHVLTLPKLAAFYNHPRNLNVRRNAATVPNAHIFDCAAECLFCRFTRLPRRSICRR
jgi:hypothetical protein